MFSIFTFQFMLMAFGIGALFAIASSLLSPYIVLSQQSMLADGLAHSAFLGFTIGVLMINQPVYLAMIIGVISSVLITLLIKKTKLQADSAIGVVSAVAFALGLVIISLTPGLNISIEGLMTGSILTASTSDLIIVSIITLLIGAFVLVFYRDLYQIVFDATNTKISKRKVAFLQYLLAAFAAVLIVIGVKLVGALLISSFIIFPTVIAKQYKRSFRSTLLIGVGISLASTFIGIYCSYYLDIPSAPTIVLFNALILLVSILIRYTKTRRTK